MLASLLVKLVNVSLLVTLEDISPPDAAIFHGKSQVIVMVASCLSDSN